MSIENWFFLSQGQVLGPFDSSQVAAQSATLQEPLIWGRGLPEWISFQRWEKYMAEIEQQAARAQLPDRMWRVRIGDEEHPPLTYYQMIDVLKGRENYQNVWIWTEGYSEWKDIYQIHKVMDELGVGRRAHPRVPISGDVVCEGAGGTFVARALSISEGGLGMIDAPQVKIGEKLKLVVKSPNLFGPLHATAEVVFMGLDGYAGMKFMNLPGETKAMIIEYVRKFSSEKLPASAMKNS